MKKSVLRGEYFFYGKDLAEFLNRDSDICCEITTAYADNASYHVVFVTDKFRKRFPVLTGVIGLHFGPCLYNFRSKEWVIPLNADLYYFLESNIDKIHAMVTLSLCIQRVHPLIDKNVIKMILYYVKHMWDWPSRGKRSFVEQFNLHSIVENYDALVNNVDELKRQRDYAKQQFKLVDAQHTTAERNLQSTKQLKEIIESGGY